MPRSKLKNKRRGKGRSFERVLQVYILLFVIVLGLTLVGIVYWIYSQNSEKKLEARLIEAGNLVSHMIDGDIHRKIGREVGSDSASYNYIQEQLINIRDSSDLFLYVYTWRLNDSGDLVFVVDADPDENSSLGSIYPESITVLEDNYSSMDGPLLDYDFTSDDWGVTRSLYVPIFTSSGVLDGVVGIDVQQSLWNEDNQNFIQVLFIILLLSVIISWFLSRLIAKSVMNPFVNLVNDVKHLVKSNFKGDLVESKFLLLSELASSFNRLAKDARKNRTDIEQEVNQIVKELEKLTEVMSEREIKMRELKKEISQLKKNKK